MTLLILLTIFMISMYLQQCVDLTVSLSPLQISLKTMTCGMRAVLRSVTEKPACPSPRTPFVQGSLWTTTTMPFARICCHSMLRGGAPLEVSSMTPLPT